MKVKGIEVTVSEQWTPEERVNIVTVLLLAIQDDIYKGTYSKLGRPNITSVLHVLHESAETLNKFHNDLEFMLMTINRDDEFQGNAS